MRWWAGSARRTGSSSASSHVAIRRCRSCSSGRSHARRRCTRPPPISIASVPDIEQGTAGLATYAYRTLGWRHAAIVAEDAANGWGGASAFAQEFCALGGSVQIASGHSASGRPVRSCAAFRPRPTASSCCRTTGRTASPVPFIRALARAARRCAALAAARALDVPAPGLRRLCSLWPRLRGVGGAAGQGVPDPVLARRRRPTARPSRRHFPGCRRASRAASSRRPYYDARGSRCCNLSRRPRGQLGDGARRVCARHWTRCRLDTPSGPRAARPQSPGRRAGDARAHRRAATRGAPSLQPVASLGDVDQTLGGLLAPSDSPSPAPDRLQARGTAALGEVSSYSPAAESST